MNKKLEKLFKIQNRLNKNRFHLCIEMKFDEKCRWVLFQYMPNIEDYFSEYNAPIMISTVDTIDDLINYLEKHEGFERGFRR